MNFRIDYSPKKETQSKPGKTNIAGRIVAITGSLPGMNRIQAERWVTNKKNAAYSSKVDRSISYLIVGKTHAKKPSSKIVAADRLKIRKLVFEDIA